MRAFAAWLAGTPPSVAIQSAFWFIRLLQAVHLLTAGVAAVSGLMIALRALGCVRRDEPFGATWRRFAPWLGWSLAIMVASGLLQVLGDPVREFTSTSFWLKMALLLACAAGTRLLGRALDTAPPAGASFAVKLAAAALILCWLAIPLLGRMIAYDRAIWAGWSLRA